MAFAAEITREGKTFTKNAFHRCYDRENPNVNKPSETFASTFILNGQYK